MAITFEGVLADRSTWRLENCSIAMAMDVIGTRSSMLILREAFYGTTRFDDFYRRVGITRAAAAARLNELVDAGLLTRRPYREPGQRGREEYVLTPAGVDFMPVVWAMFEWGRRHLPTRSRLRLAHADCGAEATVEIRCAEGHRVPADELVVRVDGR